MTTQLANPSIAILVANGFDENHITAVQRSMTKEKLSYKIIAPEQGLANGWQDNAWGHYFTVDENISSAMGSDYDFLILVGGERGTTKLKSNLHTRRIVNHFLEASKPVAAIGTGVSLLALSPKSAGLQVAAAQTIAEEIGAAKMETTQEECVLDGAVLTAAGGDIEGWVARVIELVATCDLSEEGAQAA